MTLFEPANLRIFDAALQRHRAQVTGEPASDCEALADLLATAMQWAHERGLPWNSILRTANCDFEAGLADRRQKSVPYRLRVPASGAAGPGCDYHRHDSAPLAPLAPRRSVRGNNGPSPSGEDKTNPIGEPLTRPIGENNISPIGEREI